MTRDELLRERDLWRRMVDEALHEQERHIEEAKRAGEKAQYYLNALRDLHAQLTEAAK